MEIFNIGPWELLLILVLALIVFGPEGMVKFSRDAAHFIRKLVRSPLWRDLVSTSEELKTIPQQIIKETQLEESMREISHLSNTISQSISSDLSETINLDDKLQDAEDKNDSHHPSD
ncbi:twin-arginine translocase TatA/TatE family subunit [Leptolinea tardivitalis]|uniref:Twin-arginine translocase TatA/TatE family subunit n=1 Tax=Leptolinea tardivitalis TaxID=229920 RepID=A0A0P6WMK6_9CHLR|nr:twin-arginine translocase TatA/TatE family subunit [Leptolinea tardivitalis]KPL71121.1 hypothetical protein ADM99_12710 [Leptolinea tardivitalis]GAP22553.1 Sec-independent protein secretion pathway components [Leptolinea tardivitalis]